MENISLTTLLDIKIDTRERKQELLHLKTWTKYYVKIEAVKCFPCFIKISLLKNQNDDEAYFITRINTVGIDVQFAASRTKPFSYGIFWKNNRKRCCAYLAFETQKSCEKHCTWLKKSIKLLEIYRQEILLTKRTSRLMMEMEEVANSSGLYENLSNTQNIKDLKDRLGPLPDIPNADLNWSRRVSGVSGIYEEISFSNKQPPQNQQLQNNHHKQKSQPSKPQSRCSVASGIYEEMHLTPEIKFKFHENDDSEIPPPLPPRTNSISNSDYEMQRSFTNPESDYFAKKKHWSIFDAMFGRKKRTNSQQESISSSSPRSRLQSITSSSSASSTVQTSAQKAKNKFVKFSTSNLSYNKRNSFSSPDLGNLNIYYDNDELTSGYVSSEFLDTFDDKEIISSAAKTNTDDDDDRFEMQLNSLNISQQIKTNNFNVSHNSSKINLVGFGHDETTITILDDLDEGKGVDSPEKADDINVPTITITKSLPEPIALNLDGYCVMGAKGFNKKEILKIDNKIKNSQKDPPAKTEVNISEDKPKEIIYENLKTDDIRYENIDFVKPEIVNIFDEKIPSYYPNESYYKTPPRRSPEKAPKQISASKKQPQRKSHEKCTTFDSLSSGTYKTLQPHNDDNNIIENDDRKFINHHRIYNSPKPLNRTAKYKNSGKFNENRQEKPKPAQENSKPTDLQPTVTNDHTPESTTKTQQKLYKKNNYTPESLEKIFTKKNDFKFSTISNFRRIDLSPLKLRINNILQRATTTANAQINTPHPLATANINPSAADIPPTSVSKLSTL
uniref:Putative scrambled n=1 Tax=Corethrella appendiculata TaxID=1370023 RepID=U5EFW8_9DIPT